MKLYDWLAERQENALSIARTKQGADRAGWLEDAEYFGRARAAAAIAQALARMLTSTELADCCGGCRTNSAIETWMQRAVDKFCEVNGIQVAGGVQKVDRG